MVYDAKVSKISLEKQIIVFKIIFNVYKINKNAFQSRYTFIKSRNFDFFQFYLDENFRKKEI